MTLGTTAVPRSSQNSAVPALRWSSSYVPPTPEATRDGGARSAWNLPIPQPPLPLRALRSRLAPSASIFSSSFYPSEKTEETLKKSIQLNGKPGVGEGAIFLLPSISKVWGRPREMARKSQVAPRPTHLVNLHTTVTHSAGGPAAPAGGGFPPSASALTHTFPPQLPGPMIGTLYCPSLSPLWL